MADEKSEVEKEREIPGIEDVQAFSQQALRYLVGCTQKANALPGPGEDHDFYYSFSDFREFRKSQGTRLLDKASDLLQRFHVRCGWPRKGQSCDSIDTDDLFENLVEANDIILEEVDTKLDEAAGLIKNKKPVINLSVQPGKPVVSSWNRRSHDGGKDTPVRLLLAKNILRPQIRFKDKIDNTNSPFVPIIKYKPNAIKELQIYTSSSPQPEDIDVPSALADFIHQQRLLSNNTTKRISHPYEPELHAFEPPESQLEEANEQLYESLEETPYTYVETLEQLEELSQKLSTVTEFAIDLEHHSYRSFQGFVCLMQISTRDHDYLIDTLELRSDMNILSDSFTDPKILKILHGADMDIVWLQRDFGLYIVNMFDTGQASRVLTYERFSLSYLLKKFCGVMADKQYQLADWRIRPLPTEMVRYAREDTHYLLYIYDRLHNELIKTGNAQNNLLLSVYQRSKNICLKHYEKPLFTKESYLNLYRKQRRPLNPQKLQVFQALYKWRDTLARQEDESCGYVLPNHMLFNLAESLPREPQGVLACCNPIPTLVKQYINEVYHSIQDAKECSATTTKDNTPSREAPMDTSSRSPMIAKLDVPETRNKKRENTNQNASQVAVRPINVHVPSGPKVTTKKPVISIFDYPQDDGCQMVKMEGQKKAKQIMEAFVNPFRLVLAQPEVQIVGGDNKSTEQSQASIDKINQNWKTTSADVKEETSNSVEALTKNIDSDSDQEDCTPLRQKIENNNKRKRRNQNGAQEDDTSSTPTEKKTKPDDVEDDDDPSYDAITKIKREFVPFDYTPAKYSKREGNQKQSKPHIFNPYEQGKRNKKAKGSGSKVHMKAGERSMTYSKNRETQKKQQWPSK